MTLPDDAAVQQDQQSSPPSYYAILGLQPQASDEEIRQAYRRLSRLYHPDTTRLSPAIATAKFQLLNEAYGTLNNATRRSAYDRKLKLNQSPPVRSYAVSASTARPSPKVSRVSEGRSAYLDPGERPLSPGEIFAVFILGLTFLGCLILAIAIGITRGDMAVNPTVVSKTVTPAVEQLQAVSPPPATASLAKQKQVLGNPLTSGSPAIHIRDAELLLEDILATSKTGVLPDAYSPSKQSLDLPSAN